MSQLDLARLQFAMTSIYHFLFVPVTIGLSFLTALLQTSWYRTGREDMLRLTRFFGTLLVINVAVGVVTGLVQEFQFGMDWSGYARTVGDVFGAPLAMEGLAAFFLESVFLGLWLFGWDKLSRRVHLFTIWMVALGGALSAMFILAANSWMQHPVGYTMNKETGRPQLSDIWAVMTNPVFIRGYVHVLLASLVTGAIVMLAISAWQLRRGTSPDVFARSARLPLIVLAPAIFLNMIVGSELGVIEDKYQPMKIAAAEAQWETCQPCSFSLFQIGGGNNDETPTQIIEIPHLLSLLATNSWNGKVEGLNEVQAQYTKEYGPGDYVPNVFIQYWSMRVMAYTAGLVFLLSALGTLAGPPQAVHLVHLVPAARGADPSAAVHHQHRRLGADGERSSALDRARHPADQGRCLPLRLCRRGLVQPDGVLPAVRLPRGRRHQADVRSTHVVRSRLRQPVRRTSPWSFRP